MKFVQKFFHKHFAKILTLSVTLAFLAFWVWFTADIGQTTILRCRALEPKWVDCQLQKSVLGFGLGAETVTSISSAEWSEDCDDDCSYALLLQTRTGASVRLPAIEQDRTQVAQFKEFVRGEDAPPQMDLAIGNDWVQLLIVWGAGIFIASGFVLPLILDKINS